MRDEVIDDDGRRLVEELCQEIGVAGAAKQLDVGKDSLLRVLAKQPIRRGTLHMLRQALERLGKKAAGT